MVDERSVSHDMDLLHTLRTSHVSRQHKLRSEDNFQAQKGIQKVEKSSLFILKIEK
jgi:hypothetical protein